MPPISYKSYKIGKEAYKVLISCVETAINEEEPEVAVICASALMDLAKAEKASYFGYELPFDYNTAINTVRDAYKFAKGKVPSWLEYNLKEIEKEFEEETGEKLM